MIDLHSHLLPAVDDGSQSVDESVEVLERFARDGVTVVALTPHLDASRAHAAPVEEYREILAELQARAPAVPELMLGFEIMLDIPGADLTARHFALGDSRAALVEFPRTGVPSGATGELQRLRRSGVVPILAHPERYWGCTPERVAEWRRAGAVIQMDAAGLLGSESMTRIARAMLAEGLVDIIASDNHGDTRSMAAARDWLIEIGATEQAHLLTAGNPQRVLSDQPMLPVAPVVMEKGMFGRLRDLVLGRR